MVDILVVVGGGLRGWTDNDRSTATKSLRELVRVMKPVGIAEGKGVLLETETQDSSTVARPSSPGT